MYFFVTLITFQILQVHFQIFSEKGMLKILKHFKPIIKQQGFRFSTSSAKFFPEKDYPDRDSLPLGDYEHIKVKHPEDVVNITVVDREEEVHKINGKINDNIMFLLQHNDIEIEGACEASLACCTCHVYVDDDNFDKIPEPLEEEDDMLDLAPFLKENSRLGCQIILKKELEGMTITLPKATSNFYVDGHVPEGHH